MLVAATLFALVLSIQVCLLVTWLVGRKLSIPGAKRLFVAVVAEIWWLLCYLGELLAGTPTLTVTFVRLQWLGVAVIPVAWALFVVEYTGRGPYLTRLRIAGLSIIPGVTILAVLGPYEEVIRQNIAVQVYGEVSTLTGDLVSLGVVFAVFTWLVVTASVILLIEFVVDRGTLYTKRALALIWAGIIPIFASMVETFELVNAEVLQLTPLSFALSSGLAALAIVEFDMFRSAPVPSHLAAETAVAAVDDPTFVLDVSGTVVDCNPAACTLVGVDRAALLGTPGDEVEPLADIDESNDPTVTVDQSGAAHHYDVNRTAIDGDGDYQLGSVLTLRDVTDRRKRKQRLNTLNDVLRATIQEEMTTVKRAVDEDDDVLADTEELRDRAAMALDMSDRAGDLASMTDPDAASPADIVPIIHEEIDDARGWRPEVSFVLDATLDEWAHCSGLFEPVFRASLRQAAQRSLAADAEPVVGVSVTSGPEAVTVSVSDGGPPLSDHERAVLLDGAEPRPADQDDMSRWLINWGIEQAGGTIRVGTDGDHTSVELTFPRTDGA